MCEKRGLCRIPAGISIKNKRKITLHFFIFSFSSLINHLPIVLVAGEYAALIVVGVMTHLEKYHIIVVSLSGRKNERH